MAKENRVEYERVDEKGDKYRRILAKFNPHFLRSSDFEIEFVPIVISVDLGRVFVTKIGSMSTIDLYRWANRFFYLSKGNKIERGTIFSKSKNMEFAKYFKEQWRAGEFDLEPRQVISKVKRMFEGVRRVFNEPTAYAYNNYLYSGELGSFPIANEDFSIEELRKFVEEQQYQAENSSGELVERPLAEHLFDTHKTKYVETTILNFLEVMCIGMRNIFKKARREE